MLPSLPSTVEDLCFTFIDVIISILLLVNQLIPQPFFFFEPSQLVSSPLTPTPPALMPPRPPAARSRALVSFLVTFIPSLRSMVRLIAMSLMKSLVPFHEICPNRLWVAFMRWGLSETSSPSFNACPTIPRLMGRVYSSVRLRGLITSSTFLRYWGKTDSLMGAKVQINVESAKQKGRIFVFMVFSARTKTIAIDRKDDPVQYLVMRCPIFGHAVTNIWSCGNQRLVIG